MNECFFLGQLTSDVKFSFTLKKKPISVAKFNIKLYNNSVITAYSFDENADFCYRNLEKGKYVYIHGKINTNFKILIKNVLKI